MLERIGAAARWSDAVIVGNIIFLAGHTADRTRGRSLTEQTQEVLQSLDETLAQAGVTKRNLASVTIYLADMAGFEEMNAVWDAWVPEGCSPARACVESKLAQPKYKVEIRIVAATGHSAHDAIGMA